MSRRLAAAGMLAMVVGVPVAGCSSTNSAPSSEPVVVNDNATLAPRSISDGATVAADSVSFPANATTRAWAATLTAGRIIAGNRDTTSANSTTNPNGFLRTVVSVNASGDPIVIATTGADLADLLHGDLHLGDPSAPSIFPDAPVGPTIGTRALRTLDDASSGSGGEEGISTGLNLNGNINVKLSNGSFHFNGSLDADYSLKEKWLVPTGVDYAYANLSLDPTLAFTIDVAAEGDANPGAGVPLVDGPEKKFDLPGITIPLVGPVPVTIAIGLSFGCAGGVAGNGHVNMSVTANGHFKGGFRYDTGKGTTVNVDGPTFSFDATVNDLSGSGALDGNCGITASVSLLAFDVLGISGGVGPEAHYDAKFCGGTQTSTQASLTRSMVLHTNLSAVAQVPFLHFDGLSTNIFDKSFTLAESYLKGDENTCKCNGALTCP